MDKEFSVNLIILYGGSEVTASREIRRHWWQICECTDLEYKVHSNHCVEQEMAMEHPETCEQSREMYQI
jgi:hypothetical protein